MLAEELKPFVEDPEILTLIFIIPTSHAGLKILSERIVFNENSRQHLEDAAR